MVDFTRTLRAPEISIRAAMEAIGSNSGNIVLVAGEDRRLLGILTDGDIRRSLLAGAQLDDPILPILNKSPRVGSPSDDKASLIASMRNEKIRHLPIVDDCGRIVDLQTIEDLLQVQGRDNWVVIMAGGEGQRLRPLTEDIPKPMLPVGTKPILETILENFIEWGFCNFFLSVNYKAETIKQYFGDGSHHGVNIQYLHERKSLGTAGSLSLLPELPSEPIFVMNGDILTNVRFPSILEFHEDHGAMATMCIREYRYSLPYGVVHAQDHFLDEIVEKPEQVHSVNAGIYVLDPEAIASIPHGEYTQMTDLLQKFVLGGGRCSLFPIREYWIDIGQHQDLKRANSDISNFMISDTNI